MSELENRFKSLIQPIKDIALNWDIDIAESLTEYLDELDNLRISIDGGKSNLNFAEAALLIQGSTAVYSKKVEYLHQLVLQSLEFITSKKSASATTSSNGKTTKGTIDDDDILLFDNEASFLLLDHIVEEGHNINLKAAPPSSAANRNSRGSHSFLSGDNNTSRVSMSLMHSLLSDDQGTASLKLSTSMVDGSGALLVCGALPTSTGNRLHSLSARSSLQNSFQDHSRIHNSSSFQADAVPMAAGEDDHADFYDDGNDGGDWGYDGEEQQIPALDAPAHPFTVTTAAPGSPVRAAPASHTSPVAGKRVPPRRAAAPMKDMFAQLDPHLVVSGSREARRGKTYKVPAGLLRVAPNPSALRVDHLYADYKQSSAEVLLTTGAIPMKGLFNPALLPILQAKRKEVRRARMASMRLQRDAAAMAGSPEHAEMQYQNLHLTSGAALNASRHEELWSQDYADYDDAGDFGGDGGDDFDAQELGNSDAITFAPRGSNAADFAGGEMGEHAPGDDFLQETEEEQLARRVASVLNDELNQSTRTSYESICQKYIDNFNQGANLFAKETQLSRRVAEWTQRLEPILQQQEEAPQFDIHAYCEHFLEDVDVVVAQHEEEEHGSDEEVEQGAVSFGEVVAGQPREEVCRIFLACLQLVNHGNLCITPAAEIDQWTFAPTAAPAQQARAADPFTVKRSGTGRAAAYDQSEVENFRAPSLNDKRPKKSAMKGSGKDKGTKRVHVDIPSNIFISI